MDTSQLLIKIFSTTFPLVAIVSIGYGYARCIRVDMSVANKLNIDIFTPALIFSVMSAKSFDISQFQLLAIAAAIVVLGSGLLLWPLCRVLGVSAKTFLPPMMFSNSGNLGIPLIVLAFGEAALPAAVLIFIVENVLHFTVGVFILDRRTNPISVLKMPMILATIAGVLCSYFHWYIPAPVTITVDMLGQIAIPLLLFALGVRMTQVKLSDSKVSLWGAVLGPFCGVVLALICIQVFSLSDVQKQYLILFGALPPAVLNYMVAERFQQEPQQVASIVLIGNLSSLVIIPLVLFFIL